MGMKIKVCKNVKNIIIKPPLNINTLKTIKR